MGHNICAIIGYEKESILDKIRQYQLAAAFESGFTIVILDQDSVWYWSGKLNISDHSESTVIEWASPLTHFFAKEIGFKKYAIIQTEYFGGIGSQGAQLFDSGIAISKEITINSALSELGVKAIEEQDPFDTLNLGDYRDSEYYYWNSGNWAELKPNMIAGRVPGE